MEAVGAAAGVAGLTSFGAQLVQGGVKLYQLYKQLEAAPEVLAELDSRLELFKQTRARLEADVQTVDGANIKAWITRCNTILDRLTDIVQKLDKKLRASNVKGRVKIVSRHPEIISLCDELNRTTISLILANQISESKKRTERDAQIDALFDNSSAAMIRLGSMLDGYRHDHYEHLQQIKSDLLLAVRSIHDEAAGRQQLQLQDQSQPSRKGDAEQSVITTSRLKSRKSNRKWRLQISPWFASRIWTFSCTVAQNGWDINLTAANLVSEDALIFEACREGNLKLVRRLLQDGQASTSDYYRWCGGATTVLGVAAESGNAKLCQWLIDQGAGSVKPSGQLPYATRLRYICDYLVAAQDMYRFILSQEELMLDGTFECHKAWDVAGVDMFSEDNADQYNHTYLLKHCPDVGCARLVKASFPGGYTRLPLTTRLGIAIDACIRGSTSPTMFTSMLLEIACQNIDQQLASTCDYDGRNVLHGIAGHLAANDWREMKAFDSIDFGTTKVRDWGELVKRMVGLGADLHGLDHSGRTPLFSGSWCEIWEPEAFMPSWLGALDAAGVSLQSYGETEMKIWANATRDSDIASWRFGPKPEDWMVVHKADLYEWPIDVYEPRCIPGTWSPLDQRNVWTLLWEPRYEDFLEPPWDWVKTRTVPVAMSARPFKRRSNLLPSMDTYSQDDCSEVVRLIETTTRPYQRPRSFSQPVMGCQYDFDCCSAMHWWLPGYHRCPLYGRVRLGSGNMGSCARGHEGHDSGDSLKDFIQYAIDEQMRIFRRRFEDIYELRALPYAAYHPKFKYGWD